MVRLRYVQEVQLDAGTGTYSQNLFRCNSLFDPDYTGVGHQPKGFDEWAGVYNHYTVMKSTITAKAVTQTTSHTLPGIAGILLTSSSAGVTPFADVEDFA